MKDIYKAPFVEEMKKTTANMYRLGWDERNGGNISYMLENDEVYEYLDKDAVLRTIPTGFDATDLIGKIFIVTGTGKYFKNVEFDPARNLGIIRIAEMTGDISKSQSILNMVVFMALLSVNLGLINLFPIPVLDGGHVIFYTIEIITRKELSEKLKEYLFKIQKTKKH